MSVRSVEQLTMCMKKMRRRLMSSKFAGTLAPVLIILTGIVFAALSWNIDYDYAPCDTGIYYSEAHSVIPTVIFMALLYLSLAGTAYGIWKEKYSISIASACIIAILLILISLPPAFACV